MDMQARATGIVAAAAAAVLLAGCTGGNGESDNDVGTDTGATTVETTATVEQGRVGSEEFERRADLAEVDGSGVRGTAEVIGEQDGTVRVIIELDEHDERHAAAARVGTCEELAGEGAEGSGDGSTVLPTDHVELEPVVDGRSETTFDASEAPLVTGEFSLLVYEGEEASDDPADVAACAELHVV